MEKLKEILMYLFILIVLAFMILGCTPAHKTPDEIQSEFFKEQIKNNQTNNLNNYNYANRN